MVSRKHFTTPIKVTQAEDNQVVKIFSTKKSSSVISDTERYINEKYVTTNLKQELLCEIQRHFSSLQYSRESYVGEPIAQIDFLKNEVFFLTKYFSEKNELIKSVWMFHCRTMNNKINHLHERCLRILYSDKTSSFEKLLGTDRSVPRHIPIHIDTDSCNIIFQAK